ncbi:MAG: hypothetical protein OEY97_13300 [Nitrospirota bacterium]|nr:hypothetical protein [Nitrospirota bacterium]
MIEHGPDDIVSVCECEPRYCDTTRLERADIVVWEIHREKLGAGVAAAMGADPIWEEVDGIPLTHQVGTYTPLAGYAFPVYLTIRMQREDFRQVITELVVRNDGPFVLIAPTPTHMDKACSELLARRSGCFLAMADFLSVREDGRIVSGRPAEDLLAKFHAAVLPKPESNVRAFFPTPAGATWDDVTICFTDGHTVSVKVRGATGRFNYTQMGLANSRNGEPTVQWRLLSGFADEGGDITWDSKYADRRNKKRCELLSQDLKAFFRIDGDPIRALPGGRGWRTRFSVSAER